MKPFLIVGLVFALTGCGRECDCSAERARADKAEAMLRELQAAVIEDDGTHNKPKP